MGRTRVGRVEVISGPMFAGKTEELLRRVRRAQVGGREVEVLSHVLDTRRGTGADHRAVLRTWLDTFPAEEGLGEEDAVTPLRGAGLPMALNRATADLILPLAAPRVDEG